MAEEALRMSHIVKVYSNGVMANKDVTLSVNRGEIHALSGENGAGKSTLMKILFGEEQPTSGEIYINGNKVHMTSPQMAIKLGVGMVHQHFMLVPSLTVTENIIMGMEPVKGIRVDLAYARKQVEEMGKKFNLYVDPDKKVEDLTVGQKQRVEILKALFRGAKILILDEPTAVLTPQETQELFDELLHLKQNDYTIIFISHKLQEVKQICDRITIIRRGVTMGVHEVASVTEQDISRLMVGRDVILNTEKAPCHPGETLVKIKDLVILGENGKRAVDGISFSLRKGEILGIAGVEGNGQKELAEVITGIQKTGEGEILLDGQNLAGINIRGRYEVGVSYISEDRLSDSRITGMNISENIVLREYGKPPFANHSIINKAAIRKNAAEKMKQYQVRASGKSGIDTLVKLLSGGNQQKLIIARELNDHAKVIVASQPTRGLDIGATEFVRQQLIDQRNARKGVILISADLEEIMALSDRIAVLFGGKIVGILNREEATVQKIGLLMGGISEEEAR